MAAVQKRVRVVFAGDQGTGKSSFIFHAKYGYFYGNLLSTLDPFHITDIDLIDTAYSGQKLDQELKQADVAVLTHACDDPTTLVNISTYWLPILRKLEVTVPVIVVGCKLDLLDEQQKFDLKHLTSYVMKQNSEIEICIESSAKENIRMHKVLEVSRIAAIYPSAPLFDQNRILKPRCMTALTRIFRLLDTDNDGCLSEEDLDSFEDRCFHTLRLPPEMNNLKKEVKEILTDGVYDGGLTLIGFYYYYKRLREDGRIDLAWEVLKSFGWKDDSKFDVKFNVKFDRDDFKQIEDRTRDMIVELTNEAVEFLKETFYTYDTDGDGTLKMSELEDIFSSAPESSWSKAPYVDAAQLGGLSIDRFLSEWVLMTVRNPAASVMNLMFIGYHGTPFSAIRVFERGCINRDRNQSCRNVFQCYVFGPKEAGKSALLNTLHGRPFSDVYIPTKEDHYAVNTVNILGEKKTLIMREIHKVAAKHLLPNKDALATCDIAVFVYDSSSKPSWKRTAKLLQKVKNHGYKGPFLIVATKDDLDSHIKALQDSIRVCQNMGVDAPIRISSKKGDYRNVFKKIILAVEQFHLSNSETDDGKTCKQYHQLANCPLQFESEHSHLSISETDDGMSCKQYHQLGNCPLPFESGSKDSSVLGSIWFILTEPLNVNEGDNRSITGGGLCIDNKKGLIVTVAHIVTLEGLRGNNCLIMARSYKDSKMRTASLIGISPQFDLALLQVPIEDNEELEFVSLDNDVQVDVFEQVFGYVHQNDLLFTKNTGYTSYCLPESINLPAMTDKSTVDSSGCLKRNRNNLADPQYRTVLSITKEEDKTFYDLNPNLPLVQVDGFGICAGSSGCPLFKKKSKELIGLFCLQKYLSQYIIPVNLIRGFVDHTLQQKSNRSKRESKKKKKRD